MVNFVKFYSLTQKLAHHLKPHPSVVSLSPLSSQSMHAMGVPAYHSSVRVAVITKNLPIGAAPCGVSGMAGGDVPIRWAARAPVGMRQGCLIERTGHAAVVPQSVVQGMTCRRPALSRRGRAANHEPTSAAARLRASRRADALSRQTEAEDERRARLAAALRENLKRRKAQARARRASETTAEDTPPPTQADPTRS